MTPTKLSDSEKVEIVELYQTTEENTITLADRYGVSSSTIRRILQSSLPEDEYKDLVQQKQKRSARSHSPKNTRQDTNDDTDETTTREIPEIEESEDRDSEVVGGLKRRRKPFASSTNSETEKKIIELPKLSSTPKPQQKSNDRFESSYDLPREEIEEIFAEDLLSQPENLDDFEEDFDEEDFEDEDKLDEEEVETSYELSLQNTGYSTVTVLPLSESALPKTCYLVVDRFTELVTRPLMAFGELGQIPVEESQEKTLPVFENHRVAHRFSARNQRILKVPDGKMLHKTTTYLQAKGITRLLIDGKVYKL